MLALPAAARVDERTLLLAVVVTIVTQAIGLSMVGEDVVTGRGVVLDFEA